LPDSKQQSRSDGLLDRLVNESNDAIIVADTQGRIIVWNRGAESLFGYLADEATGQTLDLIIPERLRARHWEGYQRTIVSGRSRYADDLLAVPSMCRDGTPLSLEFKVTLLTELDGRPEAIGAIIRDVTSRWQADRETQRELTRLRALTDERSKRS
jgi:PAS domain S-box-containing protein